MQKNIIIPATQNIATLQIMLDQMVLRGISALNLQSMKLSQDSLKDVVGCDYKKEIDLKYHSMLFPDSKSSNFNKIRFIIF